MPLIEYICSNCAEAWTSFRRIGDKDSPSILCPRCGGKGVRKNEDIEEESCRETINKEVK